MMTTSCRNTRSGFGVVTALISISVLCLIFFALWLARVDDQNKQLRVLSRDLRISEIAKELESALRSPDFVKKAVVDANSELVTHVLSNPPTPVSVCDAKILDPDGNVWIGARFTYPQLKLCHKGEDEHCPVSSKVCIQFDSNQLVMQVTFSSNDFRATGPWNSDKTAFQVSADASLVNVEVTSDRVTCKSNYSVAGIQMSPLAISCVKVR